jgi:chromate transporter
MNTRTLSVIAIQFGVMSLLAFGGANNILPEMHRQAVDIHHWLNDADFTALFAIAQAAPGPNFLISTLVGWRAAGLPGAVLATLALCAPSTLLAIFASGLWERYSAHPVRRALGASLAALAIGLGAAGALVLVKSADREPRLALVTLAVAVAAYFTRRNPLWFLAAAAALGALGAFA